ncbi:hypothetical protein Btru_039225 [Bulinus truncatus]|nr:hypothetical protein Btru_039225 [Bulinus truncatus]
MQMCLHCSCVSTAAVLLMQLCLHCSCASITAQSPLHLCLHCSCISITAVSQLQLCFQCSCASTEAVPPFQLCLDCSCASIAAVSYYSSVSTASVSPLQLYLHYSCASTAAVPQLQLSLHCICVSIAAVSPLQLCLNCRCAPNAAVLPLKLCLHCSCVSISAVFYYSSVSTAAVCASTAAVPQLQLSLHCICVSIAAVSPLQLCLNCSCSSNAAVPPLKLCLHCSCVSISAVSRLQLCLHCSCVLLQLSLHCICVSIAAVSPLQLCLHCSCASITAQSPLHLCLHCSCISITAVSQLQMCSQCSCASTEAVPPLQLCLHFSCVSTAAVPPLQLCSTTAQSPLQLCLNYSRVSIAAVPPLQLCSTTAQSPLHLYLQCSCVSITAVPPLQLCLNYSRVSTAAVPPLQLCSTTGQSPLHLSLHYSCVSITAVSQLQLCSTTAQSPPQLYLNYSCRKNDNQRAQTDVYIGLNWTSSIGRGLISSVLLLNLYFDKRRSLVQGLSSAGIGFGSFLIVPLVQLLFGEYGFTDTFIIIGALQLHGLVAAMAFRPFSMHMRFIRADRLKKRRLTKGDESVPLSSIMNDASEPVSPGVGVMELEELLLGDKEVTMEVKKDDRSDMMSLENGVEPFIASCETINVASSLLNIRNMPKRQNWMKSSLAIIFPIEHKRKDLAAKPEAFDWRLLKNAPFLIFCISNTFFLMAFKMAFTFIPAMAISKGLTKTEAALVLTITGALDTLGRMAVLSWTSQPWRPAVFNMLLFLIAGASFFASFVVVSSLYGSMTGAFISQKIVVLVDIVGREVMPSSLGINKVFQGVGTLVGPPFAGALRDAMGTFDSALYLGGACMLGSGLLLTLSNVLLVIQKRRDAKRSIVQD